MLNAITLSVVMLSVSSLSVIMLSFVMLSIIILSGRRTLIMYAECHYAAGGCAGCHYA